MDFDMEAILFHLVFTVPLGVYILLWLWVLLAPFIIVVRVRSLFMGALGLALPGIIFATPFLGESGLRHELKHQEQFLRYSPLGAVLLLFWQYLCAYIAYYRKHGRSPTFWDLWKTNPLELEAMDSSCKLPRIIYLGRRND